MPVPLVPRFSWVLTCCLVVLGPQVEAHDSHIQLQELPSPEEAFPSDRINVMVRDQWGFLWLGTNRGLIRFSFDGYRWYVPDPSDARALVSGDIKVLLEDSQGRFWIGTNGGLHLMNRHLGTFSRVEPENRAGEIWKDRNTQTLMEDRSGQLWIGTKQGLFVLEKDLIRQEGVGSELAKAWISAIFQDEKGGIWVATYEKGLFYRSGSGSGKWRSVAQGWPRFIQAIHRTAQGTWWLGTATGLFVADTDPLVSGKSPPMKLLLSQRIESIAMDPGGNLWIGSAAGLKRLDPEGEIVDISMEAAGGAEEGAGVRYVFVDQQGMVWVSMIQGGVYFWNRFREHWLNRDFDDLPVLSIAKGQQDYLWLGTKRGGLLRWHMARDEVASFLPGETIRVLHQDKEQRLWIGTDAGMFLSQGTQSPRPISTFSKRTWRMASTDDGELWVGMDDGIWVTQMEDPSTRTRVSWLKEAEGLNQATVTAIERDSQGRFWIGTYSHGLFVADPKTQKWRGFHRQSDPALPSNEVVGLYIDRQDQIWICSVSGGLSRLDGHEQITRFGPSTGFPYQAIVSLAQDAQGRYWAISSDGLIGFNQDGIPLALYSEKDGAIIGGAAPGSVLADGDRLWFGGSRGILGFDPIALPKPPVSPMVFTSFKADGRELQQLVKPGGTIAIGEHSGTFSLTMAYMDPFRVHWGNWQYRRKSQNDTWVKLKDPQLQLGRYLPMGGNDIIEFKGTDHIGRETNAQIQVQFLPPWWRVWLPFWLVGAILLIVGFTYLLVTLAERRRRKKLIAEAKMALARQKLAEDRAAVAEKERQLEVTARRQHEVHMQVLQQHLEQVSTEMANDIHDGPLSELRGLKFHLTHINQSIEDPATSQRLSTLKEKLLPSITQNLRKVCGELLLPSFQYGILPEIEKYIANFQARHQSLRIEMDLQFHEEDLSVEGKRILYRIFRTLVKNVGDHAEASHLRIALIKNKEDVLLEVQDDGKGFSVNESYESLRTNKHFGLYMVQFFTKGLGGTFSIKGQDGKGTVASVALPAT